MTRSWPAWLLRCPIVLALVASPSVGQPPAPKPVVRIGFLARNGESAESSEFAPTVAHLNKSISDVEFKLEPLSFDRIKAEAEWNRLQFLIVNPANFLDLEESTSVCAVATLQRTFQGHPSVEFGGVIFAKAGGGHPREINDLRGKTVAAVHDRSFGGFRVQMHELQTNGIDEKHIQVRFFDTHDAVVDAVQRGTCDAGFVRSGTLEQFCADKGVDLTEFVVLGAEAHRFREFPYALSTALYPEWPFVALSHTEPAVVRKVAATLLVMTDYPNPLVSAETLSWTVASNYAQAASAVRAAAAGPAPPEYEAWAFVGLGTAILLLFPLFAERGRRRRGVRWRQVRRFLPCVFAVISPTIAATMLVLLVSAYEHGAEAFIRHRGSGGPMTQLLLGVATGAVLALTTHYLLAGPIERNRVLGQVEDLLRQIAENGEVNQEANERLWDQIAQLCQKHRVIEDELASLEVRVLVPPKRVPVADVRHHKEAWSGRVRELVESHNNEGE